MKKLIVVNWKSNPSTLSEARTLARASDSKGVVIAPPYVYLQALSRTLKKAALASQDVFWQDGGAYTGEISASQLKNLKVKYVIIGHSERRRLGETDEVISKKVGAAVSRGLKVILCVGENWNIHRKGVAAAKRYVANQLKKDLRGINSLRFAIRDSLTIAYEPVWAISTNKGSRADTPKDAAQMITHIKRILDSRVLYGGSITPKNVKSFLSQPEIDGTLVGGASLKPEGIKKVIRLRNSL